MREEYQTPDELREAILNFPNYVKAVLATDEPDSYHIDSAKLGEGYISLYRKMEADERKELKDLLDVVRWVTDDYHQADRLEELERDE